MASVVEVSGVQKRYGRIWALDGLDLRIEQGEVHGYLGPNGAGKSTTIRILLGLARATSGTVRVLGEDPWRRAAELHRRIASVPGDVALWPNLSGGETIDLLVKLRGGDVTSREYRVTRDALIEEFRFDPSRKARSYSSGNRQKVALIAALIAALMRATDPSAGGAPRRRPRSPAGAGVGRAGRRRPRPTAGRCHR